MAVQHVDEVEGDVERRDHRVRYAQIDQKIIRHCSHPLVGHNDPNDDEISACRDGDHSDEQNRPYHLAPPRQDELIAGLALGRICVISVRQIVEPLKGFVQRIIGREVKLLE